MKLSPRLKQIVLALLAVIGVYLVMAIALKFIGLDRAQSFIREAGALAPFLFMVLCAVSLILAPLSGSSLIIAGGALFGKETGFLLSFIATLIGCSSNFWISRLLGRRMALRFIGRKNFKDLDRFTRQLKSHHSIFYITVVMPLSQDLVSYAVGLTRISYWTFLISLIISGIVVVGAYIYLGSSLLEALV